MINKEELLKYHKINKKSNILILICFLLIAIGMSTYFMYDVNNIKENINLNQQENIMVAGFKVLINFIGLLIVIVICILATTFMLDKITNEDYKYKIDVIFNYIERIEKNEDHRKQKQ